MKKYIFLIVLVCGLTTSSRADNDGGLWQWVRNWWYAPAVDPVEQVDVAMVKKGRSRTLGQSKEVIPVQKKISSATQAQKKVVSKSRAQTKAQQQGDSSGGQDANSQVTNYEDVFVAMFYFTAFPAGLTFEKGQKLYGDLATFLADRMKPKMSAIKLFVYKVLGLFSDDAKKAFIKMSEEKKIESLTREQFDHVIKALQESDNPLQTEVNKIKNAVNKVIREGRIAPQEASGIVAEIAAKFKNEVDAIEPAALLYASLKNVRSLDDPISILDSIKSNSDWGTTAKERLENALYFDQGELSKIQGLQFFEPYEGLETPEHFSQIAAFDAPKRVSFLKGEKSFSDIAIEVSGIIRLYEAGKKNNTWSNVDEFKKVVTDWRLFQRVSFDSDEVINALRMLRDDPSLIFHRVLHQHGVDVEDINRAIEYIKSNQDWGQTERERLRNAEYFIDGQGAKLQGLELFNSYLELLTPQELLDAMSLETRIDVVKESVSFSDAAINSSGLIELYEQGKKNNWWTDVKEFKVEVVDWKVFKGEVGDSDRVKNALQKLAEKRELFSESIEIVYKAYMPHLNAEEAPLSAVARDNIISAIEAVVRADEQLSQLKNTDPKKAYIQAAERIAELSNPDDSASLRLFDALITSKAPLASDYFVALTKHIAKEEPIEPEQDSIKKDIIEQWENSFDLSEPIDELWGSREMIDHIQRTLGRKLLPDEVANIQIVADGFKKMLLDLGLTIQDVRNKQTMGFDVIYDHLIGQKSVDDAARELAQEFVADKNLHDSSYWSKLSPEAYLELFVRYQKLMGDEPTWDDLQGWSKTRPGGISVQALDYVKLTLDPNPTVDEILSTIDWMVAEVGQGDVPLQSLDSGSIRSDIERELEKAYKGVNRERWQELFSEGNAVGQRIQQIRDSLLAANQVRALLEELGQNATPETIREAAIAKGLNTKLIEDYLKVKESAGNSFEKQRDAFGQRRNEKLEEADRKWHEMEARRKALEHAVEARMRENAVPE